MKRLSSDQLEWHRRHLAGIRRRRRRRRLGRIGLTLHPRFTIAAAVAAKLPKIRNPATGRVSTRLVAPERLFFGEEDRPKVLDYVENIRVLLNGQEPVYLDFTKVRRAGAAASLYIAAELDRWRVCRAPWRFLRAFDLPEWDPEMRTYLRDLGLFDLLRVVNPPSDPPRVTSRRILSMRRNAGLDTDDVLRLRDELHALMGKVPNSLAFCGAISEAMNNVTHHAYKGSENEDLPWLLNSWWMTADYDAPSGTLRVAFLDQGIGIPARLPASDLGERIQAMLLGLPADDHAGRIKTALEYGETSTMLEGRGKGFRDMQAFVDGGSQNWMRVLSGCGECVYRDGKIETARNYPSSIVGTIVEWTVVVPG